MGPGSYTGLRIGVSFAKGFCYGLDIPLIGVSTLRQMALSAAVKLKNQAPLNALFCPMIDARRMEVYCAIYDLDNQIVQDTEAKIIDQDSFSDLLGEHRVYFFGDGAPKCKEQLTTHANTFLYPGINPSAEFMIPFSEKAFQDEDFQNVAYFEPYYLKDFVSTIPNKK